VAKELTLTTDTVEYTPTASAKTTSGISLSVYPNPVKDMLPINRLNARTNFNIIISDVSGNVLMNVTSGNQANVKCNVAVLKPGIYMVNVSDGMAMKTLQFVKK